MASPGGGGTHGVSSGFARNLDTIFFSAHLISLLNFIMNGCYHFTLLFRDLLFSHIT